MDGKPVEYGIGTHANSVIAFDLPEGYERFKARGGLDEGRHEPAARQHGDLRRLYAEPGRPSPRHAAAGRCRRAASHDADDAVAGLDVAEGLRGHAVLQRAANLEHHQHRHRRTAAASGRRKCKNYRNWNGSRPEGDRILVLEDTDGDGQADKQTVFYQGRDIDSAHGVCVLGNRVIVSAGDKVQVFYDDNGDLKSDRKETLFSGIGGTQHDHGIHAFVFGPDGKLYFNFGNAGKRIKDKDGKPLIDAAGNEINNGRKPYQEGMIFRCNPDGSEIETLAWNFRNNWEVTVDSFGTLWQSDNDDDGNRGVRINYVMEFGNYGYKDELTGAGWKEPADQHGNRDPAAPLALERSGRGAQPAANRRRLAHRHHVLRRDVAAQGFPEPDHSLRRRAERLPRVSGHQGRRRLQGRDRERALRRPRQLVSPQRRLRRSRRLAVRRRLVRSGRGRPRPAGSRQGPDLPRRSDRA